MSSSFNYGVRIEVLDGLNGSKIEPEKKYLLGSECLSIIIEA